MLKSREAIAAKIETSYGVNAAPGANDAILVENLSPSYESPRMNERAVVKATLGAKQQVYGGHLKTLTFDVELKGSGTADVPPEVGVLLRGCGFAETITVGTSVAYAPASTGHESLTINYYQDGIIHTLTGARGTVSFNLEAGGIGKASFSFTGHDAEADGALITPTYDATVPAPVIGASFSIGAYAAVVAKLSVDMGIKLAMPPSVNAADGFSDVRITGREVTGSFDPELVLKATKDFYSEWTSGTKMALDTGVIGSAAGNRYQMSLPAVYYRELSYGDRDGITTLEVGFGAVENTGDDEVTITFT